MDLPPSFGFAHYTGKTAGKLVRWICFNGIFSIQLNEPMLKLLIDAIDTGADDLGELEDDIFDLAETLEFVHDGQTPKPNPNFSITCFRASGQTIFTIQCGLPGLEILCAGVSDGADYASPRGKSLWAFVQEARMLIDDWKRIQENKCESTPRGYFPTKSNIPVGLRGGN